jgi:hypothetical protein
MWVVRPTASGALPRKYRAVLWPIRHLCPAVHPRTLCRQGGRWRSVGTEAVRGQAELIAQGSSAASAGSWPKHSTPLSAPMPSHLWIRTTSRDSVGSVLQCAAKRGNDGTWSLRWGEHPPDGVPVVPKRSGVDGHETQQSRRGEDLGAPRVRIHRVGQDHVLRNTCGGATEVVNAGFRFSRRPRTTARRHLPGEGTQPRRPLRTA